MRHKISGDRGKSQRISDRSTRSESKLELGCFRSKLSLKVRGGYVKRAHFKGQFYSRDSSRDWPSPDAFAILQAISNRLSSSAADTFRVFEQYELQFIPQTFTLIAECRKLNAYQGDKEDA
jgi:hypothetical protein